MGTKGDEHRRDSELVIAAESNLTEAKRGSFTDMAHWDPGIKAQTLHAAFHRKGTGLMIMICHRANVTAVRQREIRDKKLQLIVVDMDINNIPHRVIGGHAPPAASLDEKITYYTAAEMAL